MDIDSEHLTERSNPPGHKRYRQIAAWTAMLTAITALLIQMREVLDKSHVALAYLVIVLVGASRLGRSGGIVLAFVCFFAFNFFLLPPYHTLVVADDRDWLVLLAFLVTSLVAAQLLYRAQHEAATARLRTSEIDRLSTLGAETLSAGRAEEAVAAIARVIQSTLGLTQCEIFLAQTNPLAFRLVASASTSGGEATQEPPTTRVFDYVMKNSAVAMERVDGTIHVITPERTALADTTWTQRDAKAVVIPLKVRDRCVGIMRVTGETRVYLDAEQRRFAQALAYYAALGVERVRLTAEAERTEALRAANRLKDSFVAAVSHDLRTPLTTIKGLAHEMSAVDDRARIIEGEADRLNNFVENLLDLSKLNAGQVQLNLEVNAVEDLIGAALAQVAGLPQANRIEVKIPDGDVIIATFDFVQSLRCLVNLIENALKYSPADSQVEIVTDKTDNAVRLSILDRGPGIDSAHVPRIFEPFVRMNDTKTSGAGLGLAIARRIAIAQGGDVSYARRQGGGSVFTFTLPLAPAASHMGS